MMTSKFQKTQKVIRMTLINGNKTKIWSHNHYYQPSVSHTILLHRINWVMWGQRGVSSSVKFTRKSYSWINLRRHFRIIVRMSIPTKKTKDCYHLSQMIQTKNSVKMHFLKKFWTQKKNKKATYLIAQNKSGEKIESNFHIK